MTAIWAGQYLKKCYPHATLATPISGVSRIIRAQKWEFEAIGTSRGSHLYGNEMVKLLYTILVHRVNWEKIGIFLGV